MSETDTSFSLHFLSLKARYVLENLKVGLLETFYSTSFFWGHDFKLKVMNKAVPAIILPRAAETPDWLTWSVPGLVAQEKTRSHCGLAKICTRYPYGHHPKAELEVPAVRS